MTPATTVTGPSGRTYDFSLADWIDRQYAALPAAPLRFRATDEASWHDWQERLRAKIVELAGPRPDPCPLAPEVIESVQLPDDGLIREKVVYQSEPDTWVPAWLFRPSSPAQQRLPAILALHGHGSRYGKDLVADVDHGDPRIRASITRLNYAYGLEFARRGYVVLCPDARLFGERRGGPGLPPDSGGADQCDRGGNKTALFGRTLLALTVYDDQRGVDLLRSRADVDPERIGCAGLSYGGTRTTFLSALDDRIKATVISGYLNTYKVYALDRQLCGAQFIPGLLPWADLPDVTALIAPRPLLIEAGIQDETFPIAASRTAHATLERAYALLGVREHLWRDEFDAGHEWSGRLAYDFMARYLQA